MNLQILLVDDDLYLQRSVAKLLKSNGYMVEAVGTGEEALQAIRKAPPDLAVLDVGLPDTDGYRLCEEIRSAFTFPVIMLTARGDLADRVGGLEIGADDYMTKPFEPDELLARVKAQLRRNGKYANLHASRSVGEIEIDFDRRDAAKAGKWLELKKKEFELLAHLATNEGKVLSRDALFNHSWGYEMSFNTNSLDVYIYRLRQRIESDPDKPEYIHTLRGYGYKLEYLPSP